MNSLIFVVIVVVLIAFQSFTGYIQNKYLGAILPVVFSLLVLYFIFSGNMEWNYRDIFMPVIGLAAFIGLYHSGSDCKNKKIHQEMDKMRAKDKMNQ